MNAKGHDNSETRWWSTLVVGDVVGAADELAAIVARDSGVDAARATALWWLMLHLGETARMGAILDAMERRLVETATLDQWLEAQHSWLCAVAEAPASALASSDYAILANRARELDSKLESARSAIRRSRMKRSPKFRPL